MKLIKYLAFILILALFNTTQANPLPEKPIVVLITSFNNAKWYKKNLESIFSQNYSNYRVVYIDDLSPDGTADLVEAFVKASGQNHRFTLVRNKERMLALGNIYFAVHDLPDWDIVVSVDGDDWLSHNNVLSKINHAYSTKNIWLTHGKLIDTGNNADWCRPIPKDVIANNSFRNPNVRCPSHLRTFYAWLFKKIDLDDLLYEGFFYPMTWDMAMMFPMIEMAGERHYFFKEILYVYNVITPLNDNKVNAQRQIFFDKWIRQMPPYQRLNDDEIPPHQDN